MTIYVQMDNSAAVEHYRDDPDSEELKTRALTGERIFEISFPDGDEENPVTLREMIMTTMATYRHHQEAGNTEGRALVRPRWVRSNDDRLEAALVDEYRITKNEIPSGFGSEHGSWDQVAMPSLRTITQTASLLSLSLYVLAAWSLFRLTRLNLRTTVGRDWQANLMGNPANNGTGVYAAAAWIGLTADSTAPTLADTVLPSCGTTVAICFSTSVLTESTPLTLATAFSTCLAQEGQSRSSMVMTVCLVLVWADVCARHSPARASKAIPAIAFVRMGILRIKESKSTLSIPSGRALCKW